MERYILSREGGGSIDWNDLLADWPDIRLICVFPSGKAYVETDSGTFETFMASVPGLKAERVAKRGP